MKNSKSFVIFSKRTSLLITGLIPAASGLIALCITPSWDAPLAWVTLFAAAYFAMGYAGAFVLDRVVKNKLKGYRGDLDEALTKFGKKRIVKHAGPEIPCAVVEECLREDPDCDRILSECKVVNIMIYFNMVVPSLILLGIILFARY